MKSSPPATSRGGLGVGLTLVVALVVGRAGADSALGPDDLQLACRLSPHLLRSVSDLQDAAIASPPGFRGSSVGYEADAA
jgi:hypothetical protein